MIVYRDATAADAAALADFARDSFVVTFGHLYPPEDLAAYIAAKYAEPIQRAEIEDASLRYRLAFESDALVGYCKCGEIDIKTNGVDVRPVELHRLYVDERMKGRGVAQTLMDDALDWARGLGADAMYLSVWENNHRAQAFYRRYGFEHLGEHKFMVGRVADRDFIWRLGL